MHVGRSIFFEKNLRVQFDVVLDSESNGCIFDFLAPFGGELWRFENLKFWIFVVMKIDKNLPSAHRIFYSIY